MRSLPATVRAMALVPLLAVAVDQTRAAVFCAPGTQSCLEAAGRGWLGAAGVALLAVYALALALWVARAAGHVPAVRADHRRPASGRGAFAAGRLWLVGSLGVAAVCGGQALLAGALADPAALGGGWAELLALCAAAGAVVAVALRAVPAAVALVRGARPAAPRLVPALAPAPAFPALAVRAARTPRGPATAGRAPPPR